MTTCQINFSCGIFPIEVTQGKVRRLACYVQCVFYSYYTGGWLQQSEDKTSTEKNYQKITSLATFSILPVNSPLYFSYSQNVLFFLSISLQ